MPAIVCVSQPEAKVRMDVTLFNMAEAAVAQNSTKFGRVPSLLFDMELEDTSKTVRGEGDVEVKEAVRHVEHLVQPLGAAERRLIRDVETAFEEGDARDDVVKLAQKLSNLGYRVHLRNALGGGEGGDCLRNLRHSFLCCSVPSQSNGVRYIVDPHFKEQFEIAHMTSRYSAILDSIPCVYVGSEDRIIPLVEFLCSEMSLAFCQHQAVLPPWRQPSSMLSKWRPRRSLDEHFGDRSLGRASAPVSVKRNSVDFWQTSVRSASVMEGFQPRQVFLGGNFTSVSNTVS